MVMVMDMMLKFLMVSSTTVVAMFFSSTVSLSAANMTSSASGMCVRTHTFGTATFNAISSTASYVFSNAKTHLYNNIRKNIIIRE